MTEGVTGRVAESGPTAAGAALEGMPGVLGVDHVGVAVADLDEALRWYGDVLGLVCTHRERNEEQQVEEAMVAAPTGPTGPAGPAGPAGGTGAQVQLLAPTAPGSHVGRFLDRNGPGLQQLAFRVRDVAAASAHLRSRGIRVLDDEPRRGTAGSLVAFAHPKDCGGVLIELVQAASPPPDDDHSQ